MPNVQLAPVQNAHRLLHIHRNVPNVLARINSVLAEENMNITGQYLKTNEGVGYVITDINKEYSQDLIDKMRDIEGTIWMRVLY